MGTRLQDLWAPWWKHQVGDTTYRMKPLSLETFSELACEGITLTAISEGGTELWLKFFCLLADQNTQEEQEQLFARFLGDPLSMERFKLVVGQSIADPDGDSGSSSKPQRRRVKQFKDKPESEEGGHTEAEDMGFVVNLARMSGIPLSDLRRMTYRGMYAINRAMEELPPEQLNGGGGMAMLAAMLGGGGKK